MKNSKKYLIGALSLSLLAASLIGLGRHTFTESATDLLGGEATSLRKLVGTKRAGEENIVYSRTMVQTGTDGQADGYKYLRFVTAVELGATSDITSISYVRKVAGATEETKTVDIEYVYKSVVVGGTNYYYNGTELVTENPSNDFYFACLTLKFANTSSFKDAVASAQIKVNADDAKKSAPIEATYNLAADANSMLVYYYDAADSLMNTAVAAKAEFAPKTLGDEDENCWYTDQARTQVWASADYTAVSELKLYRGTKPLPVFKFADGYVAEKTMDCLPAVDPVVGTDIVAESEDPVTIEWYKGATKLEEAPIAAGSYTVKAIQGTRTIEKAYTIKAVDVDITSDTMINGISGYFGAHIKLIDTGISEFNVPAGCHSVKITLGRKNTGAYNLNFGMYLRAPTSYRPGTTGWFYEFFRPGKDGHLENILANTEKTWTVDFGGTGGFKFTNFYIYLSGYDGTKEDGLGGYKDCGLEVRGLEFIVPSGDAVGFTSSFSTARTFNGATIANPVFGTDYTTANGEPADSIEWYKGDTKLEGAPRAAGTYACKVIQGEDFAIKNVTIDPVVANVSATDNWGKVTVHNLINSLYYKANATKFVVVVKGSARAQFGLIIQGGSTVFWQGNNEKYIGMINDDRSASVETQTKDVPEAAQRASDVKITNIQIFLSGACNLEFYDMYFC